MVAPVLGLPALLQAIATIGVGGAIGYKAQKDLQPVIKQLKANPEDMDSSELRMLRALLMPNQAIASELKDMTTSKSVGTTGEGAVIGPRAEDIEQVQEEITEVSKPPVTKTPVEPITTETFPDEPQIKQDPPVQPEVDLDTKETFPADTAIDPAPVFYSKANEGGKQIRDITAGVSAQKEQVPELLEQGKLAMPIKKFFEDDNQVVNYKIGDTIGKYGQDVERSLDIEANVKKDFNIDKFSEVIKDRAKEFNQDAVFVAESVSPDFEGANIGIDLDFGSNLKMQDALKVSNAISRVAEIDGFTFKIKNFDSSNSSLYLPQTPKDQELTKETLKKYPLTEDIRKAGFIMPDGKMLNFNLRGGNLRDTEHRRVGFLVKEGYDGQDFGPMYDWMIRTGGVRVTGNQNRLFAELVGKPTPTQINKIVEEYNTNRDQYDSMIIAVTIPGEGGQGTLAPRQDFGRDTGLNTMFANDLRKATFRLPSENFYEVNGEEANASDILRRIKSADVVGKTFTGVRQLNIPEFSNISAQEAFDKITNLNNNLEQIKESTLIETLDKPKVKFYNTKVFTKGKDY
jgi:hypothetical protein